MKFRSLKSIREKMLQAQQIHQNVRLHLNVRLIWKKRKTTNVDVKFNEFHFFNLNWKKTCDLKYSISTFNS
jgi:hypothetical protein